MRVVNRVYSARLRRLRRACAVVVGMVTCAALITVSVSSRIKPDAVEVPDRATGPTLRTATGKYPLTEQGIHLGLTLGRTAASFETPIDPTTRVDYVWSATAPSANGSRLLAGAHRDFYLAATWNDVADTDQPEHSLRWFQANHPDWVAYQCNENRPTLTPAWYGYGTLRQLDRVPLDWSNPEVQDYLIQSAKAALQRGFDGIAVDNVLFTNHQAICGVYRWVDVDGKRSLAWHPLGYPPKDRSNAKFVDDLLNFYARLSEALAQEFPQATVTGNATISKVGLPLARYAPYFNGILDEEGFMGPDQKRITGSAWYAEVHQAEALNRLDKAYISGAYANAGQPGFPPTGAARDDLVEWVLANYLLVKGSHSYTYIHRLAPRFVDLGAYHVSIGAPVGPRSAIGGTQFRRYSGGIVAVNPSATTPTTMQLGAWMKDLSGTLMRSVELPPASGKVLVYAPAPSSPVPQ